MLRNQFQIYAMDVMKCLKNIRTNQFFTLMRLRFGSNREQIEQMVRQLCYGQKLQIDFHSKEYINIPSASCDLQMIKAVDVMLHVCGESSPELAKGELPCKLNFYLKDSRGYLDFKVVFVPMGEERIISSRMVAQTNGFVCTVLFVIDNEEQITQLSSNTSAYYVLTAENDKLIFLEK